MSTHSAGILVYRLTEGVVEVLLVHPGGPFWAKKDDAAWSIPKGEFDSDTEDPLDAAVREFTEETGFDPPDAPAFLAELTQPGGKIVHAWTARGDVDCRDLRSNTFEIEWPKGSGKRRRFGEVDRAAWFDTRTARRKLHKGQVRLVDLLLEKLAAGPEG